MTVALAWPARAEDLSVGLQGGLYRAETPAITGSLTGANGGSWAPVIDLREGSLGFTVKYVQSSYTFDDLGAAQITAAVDPDELELGDDGGPDADRAPAPRDLRFPRGDDGLVPSLLTIDDVRADADRKDLELSLRHHLSHGRDWPVAVTLFAGFRYEIQELEGTGRLRILGREATVPFEDDFTVVTFALGASAGVPVLDGALTPFVSASVFPLARVDSTNALKELAESALGEGVDLDVDDFTTTDFGGFAFEVGTSASFAPWFDVPVSATASFRFQRLTPGPFEEIVQQASVGLYYHFLDAF